MIDVRPREEGLLPVVSSIDEVWVVIEMEGMTRRARSESGTQAEIPYLWPDFSIGSTHSFRMLCEHCTLAVVIVI